MTGFIRPRRRARSRLLALLLAPAMVAGTCEDEPDALVSFALAEGIDPDRVTIEFHDGARTRTVTGDDFTAGPPRLETRAYATPRSGTLRVDVRLDGNGATVAAGAVEIPLRTDWRWGVSLHLDDRNPTDTCFGCFGYRAFPIAEGARTSPADSLWVVWGGNSISDPVIY